MIKEEQVARCSRTIYSKSSRSGDYSEVREVRSDQESDGGISWQMSGSEAERKAIQKIKEIVGGEAQNSGVGTTIRD